MDMTAQAWPEWYDGRHIKEVLFCQHFLDNPSPSVAGLPDVLSRKWVRAPLSLAPAQSASPHPLR